MPAEVTVAVLIVVVPETASVPRPVTVSVVASPKTALPVSPRLKPPPATVPLKVVVVALSAVLAPSVTLSL